MYGLHQLCCIIKEEAKEERYPRKSIERICAQARIAAAFHQQMRRRWQRRLKRFLQYRSEKQKQAERRGGTEEDEGSDFESV